MSEQILNLKPCECGAMPNQFYYFSMYGKGYSEFYIKCPNCGKRTRGWHHLELALSEWNSKGGEFR